MANQPNKEQWKNVAFDVEHSNAFRLEVSNFGRLRSFHKLSDGNIINGSETNGYKIVRLKLFRPREEKVQKHFDNLKNQAVKLARKIRELEASKAKKSEIVEAQKLLEGLKANTSKKMAADVKKRTIHFHALIHRLVAAYFCKPPRTPEHTLVAHLDYNKHNNHYSNLQWMTMEENIAHQQHSPYVIAEKKLRPGTRRTESRSTKLTITRVMLIKKLLDKGKTLRYLSKQFKVSETQIVRIRRGENWGDVEAAK